LPDGTGRELAQRPYGIRTLLITGHPDIADELVRADIPYLRKPFSLALLREVFGNFLRLGKDSATAAPRIFSAAHPARLPHCLERL
jgi:hypothetical protein